MNIRKALVFGLFGLFFMFGSFAQAATSDSRYFVKSTSQFWKKSLAVRNLVTGGFTSELSTVQLKLAKIFGVSIEPVKKFNILDTLTAKETVESVDSDPTTPAKLADWGVQYIYGGELAKPPSGGAEVKIAVLDTGIDTNHPDLKNRIKECVDFSGSGKLTKDSCEDKNGHGTHVAGIIAADGGPEGEGIYGVAPESDLLIYKVCRDDGSCFADDVASAINYAVEQKANIILISLGSDSKIQWVSDAINNATSHGVMVVAAAGNGGPDPESIDFPASLADVVSVGAMDSDTTVPDWSSRGRNKSTKSFIKEEGDLEMVAPGVNIESTSKDDDYVVLSGTSMAAAHIVGLAAKEWQKESKDPAAATRELLHKLTVDILPIGDDPTSGWGVPTL